MTKYHGKYRGTVFNNVDPMQQGRLQAMVPDVLGSMPSSWAMACVPFSGTQAGIWSVPPIGAGVWIEFEQGDPEFPVWTGGWWGSAADPPALGARGATGRVARRGPDHRPEHDLGQRRPRAPGGLLLKSTSGAMIMINDVGITITNGQASIVIAGPTVTINNGALVVT